MPLGLRSQRGSPRARTNRISQLSMEARQAQVPQAATQSEIAHNIAAQIIQGAARQPTKGIT